MKLELTIFELGQILKKLEKRFELNLLVKSTLSGGWITFTGKATIEKVPGLTLGYIDKRNNIIDIKIKNNNDAGNIIKLIGCKQNKFNIHISSSRYMELSKKNDNEIKINENECKLKIDENMVFTIKAGIDEIKEIIGM